MGRREEEWRCRRRGEREREDEEGEESAHKAKLISGQNRIVCKNVLKQNELYDHLSSIELEGWIIRTVSELRVEKSPNFAADELREMRMGKKNPDTSQTSMMDTPLGASLPSADSAIGTPRPFVPFLPPPRFAQVQ